MAAHRCHAEFAVVGVHEAAGPFVHRACVVEALSALQLVVGQYFGDALS